MLVLLFSLMFSPVQAADLAGVSMDDTVELGGKSLVLNGMGLREKYFIDVYVGGLYLPQKTTSETTAIDDDVPKRLLMHFVYSKVTKDQLVETYNEGLEKVPNGVAVMPKFNNLYEMLSDVKRGDRIGFDYVPGQGTEISVRGEKKGTIEGVDFMRAMWGIYLGTSPPTAKLKRGLLGQ
ncbi:MAG: chalcone isomerase family protein [Proteobacteria bacterium]|jgi:hypothetical protein|nr:chalcone isomerase family protein [Pseudomonadota bacterium]